MTLRPVNPLTSSRLFVDDEVAFYPPGSPMYAGWRVDVYPGWVGKVERLRVVSRVRVALLIGLNDGRRQ